MEELGQVGREVREGCQVGRRGRGGGAREKTKFDKGQE